jgi:glutamyl-tRNA synthetase
VRTAIFNWLFARRHGGTFILRVDDTDTRRNLDEAVRTILDGMKWVGLDWDEGPDKEGPFGPYYQSRRMDRYRAAAEKLEQSGRAYREKKQAAQLPEWKVEKLKKSGQWDEELARAQQDDRPALYFKLHAGEPAAIGFTDAVWGEYTRPAELSHDFVLLRGDGSPTYNFASVVDDIEMKISHVIRGEDHLANTPKQARLFEALGANLPTFAHLPMIHNDKGQKISKRRDPVAVTVFEKTGLLPEALFNYLALLGWSPGDDREIMTKKEMIEAFGIDRIKQSPAQFSLKRKSDMKPESTEDERARWLSDSLKGAKLEWMNAEYMRALGAEDIARRSVPFIEARGYDVASRPSRWLVSAVAVELSRVSTLGQLADNMGLYFKAPEEYAPKAVKKVLLKNDGLAMLREIRVLLDAHADWTPASLEAALKAFTERKEARFGHVAQPIRVALSGTTVSPSIHETLTLLGKEECLKRIDRCLARSFGQD